jgi:hypothetical protein
LKVKIAQGAIIVDQMVEAKGTIVSGIAEELQGVEAALGGVGGGAGGAGAHDGPELGV